MIRLQSIPIYLFTPTLLTLFRTVTVVLDRLVTRSRSLEAGTLSSEVFMSHMMTENSVVYRVTSVVPALLLKLITPSTAEVMEVPSRATTKMLRKPKTVVTTMVECMCTYCAAM